MEWYKDYFGEATIEFHSAYLDGKGRLFLLLDDLPAKEYGEHNCDAMGCGSVGPHIGKCFILKEKFNELQAENAELKRQNKQALSMLGEEFSADTCEIIITNVKEYRNQLQAKDKEIKRLKHLIKQSHMFGDDTQCMPENDLLEIKEIANALPVKEGEK